MTRLRPTSPGQRPSRAVLALLLLACFTLITLDARGGDELPARPAALRGRRRPRPGRERRRGRRTPVHGGPATSSAPPAGCAPTWPGSRPRTPSSAASSRGASADRNRVAELDGLLPASKSTGYALVPARVVAMGPAQSFSRTVTIDAGTSAGVHPDMTVLNNDGLVGRVIARRPVHRHRAADRRPGVGRRRPARLEHGGRLPRRPRRRRRRRPPRPRPRRPHGASAAEGDAVVTWGSATTRRTSPACRSARSTRSTPARASSPSTRSIEPYVDFSSLDLVGRRRRPRTPRATAPVIRGRRAADDPATEPADVRACARCCVTARPSLLAVVLQVASSPHFSFDGVVPDLALLVVVAAALVRGPRVRRAARLRRRAGLDLAPPADHIAGRWALALVVVGYLAGRVRQDAGRSAVAAVLTVARLLVRRHLDLRAVRHAAARPGASRSARRCGDPGRGRSTTCC